MTGRALLVLVLGVAAASYALRVLPLALLRRPLRSPRLVAFIERLPYAILAAMVVPDVFAASTTGDARASAAGFAVALALALLGRSLPLVAAAAVAAAFAALALLGALALPLCGPAQDSATPGLPDMDTTPKPPATVDFTHDISPAALEKACELRSLDGVEPPSTKRAD